MATNLPNLSTDLYDVATLVAALQRKFTDIPDETISLKNLDLKSLYMEVVQQ